MYQTVKKRNFKGKKQPEKVKEEEKMIVDARKALVFSLHLDGIASKDLLI